MKLRSTLLAAAVCAAATLPAKAAEYVMSASADYSGPFAGVMPNAMAGINAVADWWNKDVGSKLGVTVKVKIYDMRYDPSVIARTWPSILSSDKPILHLGFGSPDMTTLMKRLPNDKVPMLIGTAMVGLVWAPDSWHYSIRPTYSHEFAGLLGDLQAKAGRKIRIGSLSTQNQAGFVDQLNGLKKLAATYPDRFEMLDIQWADTSPVSVTSNVRAMSAQNPDVIIVGGTTAQVIATGKALDELKLSIPLVASTHNGLTEVAKGIDLAKLNGSYSAFSFTPPEREGTEIQKVFEANKKGGEWGLITAQSAAQALLALRVLEKAVAAVGPDKITGEAMRDALLNNVYSEKELLGALPALDYDTTAPFPIGAIKSTAEVVRDGKIVPVATEWFDVPKLEKW